MNDYRIENKKLLSKDFKVDFDYNIKDIQYIDNIYIILLDIPNNVDEIDNVYGVNEKGEIIWRIENPEKTFPVNKTGKPEYDNIALSVYVSINFNPDMLLTATTFFATKYVVDYKTGKLLKKEQGRW